MAEKTVELRVKRQDGPDAPPRWEHFSVPHKPGMNIISCLIEIARNPVTTEGNKTTPVQWECSCLEEVCGSCTMRINGQPRQSCSALVDKLEQPITMEPLSKFPVIRDLAVDRARMFENLKRVKAWIPIDGTYDLGPGPRMGHDLQQDRYDISRCMTCACCMEVCPQVNLKPAPLQNHFIGPAAVAQVKFFNAHPTGGSLAGERLDEMMGEGGLHECGNAQNCIAACPKEIRLTDAIAEVGRQVTVHAVKKFFGRG